MGHIDRTSDVVVFLRAHARDIDATILRTRNRLRQSNDRAWRSRVRITALQESLDQASMFLTTANG
jgi:hypothetical protein